MFGKTKDSGDIDADLGIEQFFGDEAAAAEVVRVDDLHHRVNQVEQQVNSQFTSLAAYAQIAQEQIEMARSEAKHATERTERRVTELIERERADRIQSAESSVGVVGSPWTAPDVAARLDALERSVSQIQHGLNECLARQKALADAITALFEPQMTAASAPDEETVADALEPIESTTTGSTPLAAAAVESDPFDEIESSGERIDPAAVLPPPPAASPSGTIGALSIL